MLRLNSQLQQYDWFTLGQRVFRKRPKMPINNVRSPHFKDFASLYERPVTQTQDLVAKLRMVQKASLESDLVGEFNLALRTDFRNMGNEQFCSAATVFSADVITVSRGVAETPLQLGVPGASGIVGDNPEISVLRAIYNAELSKSRAAADGAGRIWDIADFKAGYLARMAGGGGDERIAPTGQFGAANGPPHMKPIGILKDF